MARLKEYYVKDVAPALMKKFSYKSVMQIPKLDKIVINVSCGEAGTTRRSSRLLWPDLSAITGQRPWSARPGNPSPNFKLREGMNIGAKVTLRGERMYEFLDRLSMCAPRVRDFRGTAPIPSTAAATITWA